MNFLIKSVIIFIFAKIIKMKLRILYLFVFISFSCSSKKDVLLVQDIEKNSSFNINYKQNLIKPDDILKITITSQSDELTKILNYSSPVNSNNNLESFQLTGYLVNPEGFINLPNITNIYVKNYSVNQLSNHISDILQDRGILVNPTVDVRIVNSYFTILGEVNLPGRYNFIDNNLNILQAIGIAGGLTINSERDNIKVLRHIEGNLTPLDIDLTKSNFISSDEFQVFSRDIIIVNPNKSRVINAGVVGNSSSLLSILSFVITSILLINSN